MGTLIKSQLCAEGIAKRYGSFVALDDVSISVRAGEFLTLLGPSGSGKTTLLMILAGFVDPSAGRLLEDGVDITHRPPEKRNFGMVFQGYALFPHMSVFDNVAFALRVRKVDASARRERVTRILDVVGLGAHSHKRPHQLSGGQQQRVAIARALVFEPELLLLDEPLSALDKNMREQLQVELRRIHQQVGTTFMFVTHDQEEALALSTRIAIFDKGQLVQIDTPEQIYACPVNRFVGEFLGKMNVFALDSQREDGEITLGNCGAAVLRAKSCGGCGPKVLAVRPEHMKLHVRPPIPSTDNVVMGTIVERMFHGSRTTFSIRTSVGNSAGCNVLIDAPPDHPARTLGSTAPVWLSWCPSNSILLAA
ncbi:ABC transporter ATP-binding protein [Verminephrobacter eiseniae]|uniref:ABC transporter ATP-binding protein n=1 Tax=Verminephrobacter eiseniae TaxID=364317 RepID=UPI002236F278|nr:ABC transporter ATP-binding protein [Verminephrobacter eiseniae]MCW5259805.1 ABC transporter ATP-binding protein [Verminephrobacter eiseniae]